MAKKPKMDRNTMIINAVGWIVIIVIVGLIGKTLIGNSLVPQAGESFPILGQEHVDAINLSNYNSVPPTSGPHLIEPARWGVHLEEVPEGQQIHNLEHGGILIQYRDAEDSELIDELLSIIGEIRGQYPKIVLAPYSKMPQRIALTGWGRLESLESADKDVIENFVSSNYGKAPEGNVN